MTDKKQLGDLLVEAGIITSITLQRALERQKGTGKRLGIILEEMGVITDEELVNALSKQFNYKSATSFAHHDFAPELLKRVPEHLAVQKLVFPLKEKENMLALAITDPFDVETIDFIARKNNMQVIPIISTRNEITTAVNKYYLKGKERNEKRRKVLVVDDSQSVATIIQVALMKEGFDVVLASDGLDGLKMAISEQPDLIICDSVMPRMDGFGLLRALKANPATLDVPLLLLTSKATGEEEQRALEAGFLDFIAKPVQPIRVVSRVKRAFELLERFK